MIMCNHKWNEYTIKSFDNWEQDCRMEIRVRSCIFCGKIRKEVVRVKDPSKRVLPKFIRHDLSDQ